jgi:hypothetical protein
MKRKFRMVYGLSVIVLALGGPLISMAADTTSSLVNQLNGRWKENEAKRKLGSSAPMRFQRNSKGELEELRGTESVPLSEPVHFDGKPYPVNGGRGIIVWRQTSPNKFERQSFAQGKLVLTRRIEIAADGKKLTEAADMNLPNGGIRSVTVDYSRAMGTGTGLEGRWKPESFRTSSPDELIIQPAGTKGITVTNPLGQTYTATLDGTPAEVTGPVVISGITTAIKPLNDHTLQVTVARNGVQASKGTWTLSPDGKTLTMSTTRLGPDAGGELSVAVYEKQ